MGLTQGHRKEQESCWEGQVDLDQRQKQTNGSLDGNRPFQEYRDLLINSKEYKKNVCVLF